MKQFGIEAVEIPEHEVITRRKQFRMKKDRAQAKQAKKEKKKEGAAVVEAKKAAKKAAKAAKERSEDEKKGGRTSSAKLQERTSKKSKKETTSKKKCKKTTPKPAEELLDASEPVASGEDELDPNFPTRDSEERFPVKSKKMKRLHHMSAKSKGHHADITLAEGGTNSKKLKKSKSKTQDTGEEVNSEQVKKASKASKGKGRESVEKSRKETSNESKKRKASKSKVTKTTRACKEQQGETKSDGKKAKSTGNEAKGKVKGKKQEARRRTPKPKKVYDVDETAKDLALETLKECQSSGCCHPSFKAPDQITGVSYSPYWTRKALGVKVDRRFLQSKKAKGSGQAQIAYFGSASPCTYASWTVAALFVSRWHAACGLAGIEV